MTVYLPRVVAVQLETIRQSGETNMLDRPRVQQIANREEMYELMTWLEDHKREYSRLIFCGFEIEEGSGRSGEPTEAESEAFWTAETDAEALRIYRTEK